MTTTASEATFSELLQKPKDTVAKIDKTPRRGIRITRRDGEDLYLTTAARADQATEVVDSTTRMFVALMKSDPAAVKMLTGVFPEAFPWVRFLPQEAVREFLVEFMDTARAASDLGTLNPLAPLISAWKSTAEIYADPDLRAQLTRTDGSDYGPVAAPEVGEE
jgi:hypothetical protein